MLVFVILWSLKSHSYAKKTLDKNVTDIHYQNLKTSVSYKNFGTQKTLYVQCQNLTKKEPVKIITWFYPGLHSSSGCYFRTIFLSSLRPASDTECILVFSICAPAKAKHTNYLTVFQFLNFLF